MKIGDQVLATISEDSFNMLGGWRADRTVGNVFEGWVTHVSDQGETCIVTPYGSNNGMAVYQNDCVPHPNPCTVHEPTDEEIDASFNAYRGRVKWPDTEWRSAQSVITYLTWRGRPKTEKKTGVCHGFTRSSSYQRGVVRLATYPTYGEWEVTDRMGIKFLRWLANKSPFSPCFKTRKVSEGLTEGFVMNLDVPSNLLQGALIATRMPRDYPHQIECWDRLVKEHGINPNAAFVVSSSLTMGYDRANPPTLTQSDETHHPLCTNHMTAADMASFVKGEYANPEEHYLGTNTYDNVHSLWYNGGKRPLNLAFKEEIEYPDEHVEEWYDDWEDQEYSETTPCFSTIAGAADGLAEWLNKNHKEYVCVASTS
jgi:hypothetical protein